MAGSERLGSRRFGRLVLALTLVSAVPSAALAQRDSTNHLLPRTIRLHLGSWHDRGEFNNANLGVALRWNRGLVAGGFHNSFGRASWYGGLVLPAFERGAFQLELMTGVITGYSEASPIDLVAVPTLGWRLSTRNSVQVVFMPRLVIPANAVHVMLEHRIGGSPASIAPRQRK